MKLIDYLNQYSWSKADLARKAEISTASVTSALDGQAISRRNAQKIVAALQTEHERLKRPGVITLASVRGLKISDVKRKKKPREKKEIEPPEDTNMKVPGGVKKVVTNTHDEDLQALIDVVTEHPELTSGNAIFKSKSLPFGRSKITDLLNEAIEAGRLPGNRKSDNTEETETD